MVMPLHVLEKSMNKKVSLLLKDNRILEGKLVGYDDYMNIVLRGNNVVTIVPKL